MENIFNDMNCSDLFGMSSGDNQENGLLQIDQLSGTGFIPNSFENQESLESYMGFLDNFDDDQNEEVQAMKELLEKELELTESTNQVESSNAEMLPDIYKFLDGINDSGFNNNPENLYSTIGFDTIRNDTSNVVTQQTMPGFFNNGSDVWVNENLKLSNISNANLPMETSFNDPDKAFMFVKPEENSGYMMSNVELQNTPSDVFNMCNESEFKESMKTDENNGSMISYVGAEVTNLQVSNMHNYDDGRTQLFLNDSTDPNQSVMYVNSENNVYTISSVGHENNNFNGNENCNFGGTAEPLVRNDINNLNQSIICDQNDNKNDYITSNVGIENKSLDDSYRANNINQSISYFTDDENFFLVSNNGSDMTNLDISNVMLNDSGCNTDDTSQQQISLSTDENGYYIITSCKNENTNTKPNEICNIDETTELISNNVDNQNVPFMITQPCNDNNFYTVQDFVNSCNMNPNSDVKFFNAKLDNIEDLNMDDEWFYVLKDPIDAEIVDDNSGNNESTDVKNEIETQSIVPIPDQNELSLNNSQSIEPKRPDLASKSKEDQIESSGNKIIEKEILIEIVTMKPNPALMQVYSPSKMKLEPLSATRKSPPRVNKRKQPLIVKKGSHIIFDYKPKEDIVPKVSKVNKPDNYTDENFCEVDAIFNRAKKKGGAVAVPKPTKYRKNKKFDTLTTKQPLHENVNKRKNDDNNSLFASYDEFIHVIETPKLSKFKEAVMITAEEYANQVKNEKFGKCPKCSKIYISAASILFHLEKCPVLEALVENSN